MTRDRGAGGGDSPATIPRVLFVDHTAVPGGAELALARLMGLTTLDCSVAFLADGPIAQAIERSRPGSTQVFAGGSRFAQVRWLRSVSRDRIIVSNSLRATLLCAIAGVPRRRHVMLLRDGVDAVSLAPEKRAMTMLALTRVGGILANSGWSRSTLPAFARKRAAVVFTQSGVTSASVAVSTERSREPDPTIRIVFLGRLAPWKGAHVLLDAVEILGRRGVTGFDVVIVGGSLFADESYAASLRTRVAQADLPIVFAGHVEDVGSFLETAHILVHASTRPEPFGQVLVQGLGHGCAVIATAGGGPSELLEELATDGLVPMGDPDALADALARLVREPGLRAALARTGLVIAERYTDEATVELFDAELRRYVAGGGRMGSE
ncbi:Glycosyltransferase involved in cell wall bisynthesis [Demequina mangrovi]|uniref:Glycosyltransferase involved in cell wall bisynthesis n=1 Tax=Demequina mangrovi TaxID=1043493 RepID=A0A1H6YN05_9MICO|nr:Glycosyltransferase involved in cell wall bisynthesis [Demequina mangrovi]